VQKKDRRKKKRKSIPESLVITDPFRIETMGSIRNSLIFLRNLDYSIKLTNGSNPEMAGNVINRKLVDYVALDFKAKPESYPEITGVRYNYWCEVMRTVLVLRRSDIEYEYRMTCVPGLSDEKDLMFLSEFLKEDEKLFVVVANPTERFKPYEHVPKVNFRNVVWRY